MTVDRRLPPLRVLLTRPAPQAEGWAHALSEAGARPVLFPTIEVKPPPSFEALDEALGRLATYEWVLFSSAAAVRFTLGRLGSRRLGPGLRVAAVGAETARALERAGIKVDVVPRAEHAEGLANALGDLAAGTRILFPQALGGRVELREALCAQGCLVDVVAASQTVPVSPLPPVPAFDVSLFASPSALRAFVSGAGRAPLAGKPVVVIGGTTGATARALGLFVHVAASPRTEAVIDAIAASVSPP